MASWTSLIPGNWSDPLTWHQSHPIAAVNTAAKRFRISDVDVTSEIMTSSKIRITGSNDGIYTVTNSTFAAPDTLIEVEEVMNSSVADGTITSQTLPATGDNVHVATEVVMDVVLPSLASLTGVN